MCLAHRRLGAVPSDLLRISNRNAKFADGLAQSRLRFLGDLENLFGSSGPLEETLEKLEEVPYLSLVHELKLCVTFRRAVKVVDSIRKSLFLGTWFSCAEPAYAVGVVDCVTRAVVVR